MGVMEALTAMLTITAPIIVTVVLTNYQTQRIIQTTIETSNRQTQRIIQNSNHQTQCVLQKLERCLVKISRTQEEIKDLQRETHRCLLKLDFGFKANAAMHGWDRLDNISPEEVRKLPEPKVYDPKLRICYYKAD